MHASISGLLCAVSLLEVRLFARRQIADCRIPSTSKNARNHFHSLFKIKAPILLFKSCPYTSACCFSKVHGYLAILSMLRYTNDLSYDKAQSSATLLQLGQRYNIIAQSWSRWLIIDGCRQYMWEVEHWSQNPFI